MLSRPSSLLELQALMLQTSSCLRAAERGWTPEQGCKNFAQVVPAGGGSGAWSHTATGVGRDRSFLMASCHPPSLMSSAVTQPTMLGKTGTGKHSCSVPTSLLLA